MWVEKETKLGMYWWSPTACMAHHRCLLEAHQASKPIILVHKTVLMYNINQ